jgi:hypothetical protein
VFIFIEAAAKFFNDTVQWADHTGTLKAYDYPILIEQKMK